MKIRLLDTRTKRKYEFNSVKDSETFIEGHNRPMNLVRLCDACETNKASYVVRSICLCEDCAKKIAKRGKTNA